MSMPMLQGKQSGLPQDFLIKWQATIKQLNNEFSLVIILRAKTREKDTYIEFSMAGSLENRGKLRELIDKLQFAKLTKNTNSS